MVAIDRDPEAIRAGRERFAGGAAVDVGEWSVFAPRALVAADAGLVGGFDGVLLDLGVSSPQLDDAARGFSFAQDGPLDMRMDNRTRRAAQRTSSRSAPEHELARVIREYGEETLREAHRARDRRGASRGDRSTRTGAARGDRRARRADARARQASRHAHVPGDPHPRERRVRARSRRRSTAALEVLAPRRPLVRDQFSFAGRRHREALHAEALAGGSGVRRACRDIPRACAAEAATHRPRRPSVAKRRSPRIRVPAAPCMRVAERVAA